MLSLSRLDTLPPWLLVLLIVGGSAGVASFATVLIRRRTKPPLDDRHNEVAGFIFAAVSVLYAVVLAFMVFAVWEEFNGAKQAASNEASAVLAVARDATSLPEPARHQVRELLRRYCEIVAHAEWSVMGQSLPAYDGSPRAQAAIDQAWAIYEGLPRATVDNNATLFLSDLSQQRAIRLETNDALSGVFGVVLVGGAVLTISFCLVLHMEDVRLHAGMTAILTALIALCLWLILEMNNPYAGSLSVTPGAFEHAMHAIDMLPN